MKKTVCLILLVAMTAGLLCGCGFNYDKEDLSKYVDLADFEKLTFADFENRYAEYRKYLAEQIKSNNYTFAIDDGFSVDISVTAEIISEESSGDGSTTTVSYTRYEKWCFDGDDKCIENYCIGKNPANQKFDNGLHYNLKDIADGYESEREVSIDKPFSFTMTIPSSYEDDTVAGKPVRFTVIVTDVLPGTAEDELYSEINAFFEKCGYKKDKSENGDWVVIDFTATVDGKSFKGNTAENFKVRIGGGYFFESLDSSLIGRRAGEKYEVDVTFPEKYEDTSVAGKKAKFSVTVKEVYNTDETVRKNTGFADYYELKNALRVVNYMKNKMMDAVVEKSTVKEYPKALITQYEKLYEDEVAANVASAVKKHGVSEDEAKKLVYGSAAAADEFVKTSAEKAVKEALITHAVKKALGLKYTNADYQKDLENMRLYLLYYGGYNLTASELEGLYTKDALKIQFLYQTCNEKLCEVALPKDTPDIPGLK